ncbi:GIY-YIG nuclease family protein [Acetobacteraceae bacterium]|nr:GIY-YIG nuclease family protein [Candidatus Parcubacteria bacterium]
MYHLYILTCADGTLYTGIALDIKARVKEHNSSTLGAKYTRTRRPVYLSYSKEFLDRSSASREEYRVKQLSRDAKLQLIKTNE